MRLFSKIVDVFLHSSDAILIIGASDPSRLIASYLRDKEKRVVLIDANKNFIEQALDDNLEALNVNIYDDDLRDNIELNDVGYLLALTGNDDVNKYALTSFQNDFGEHGAYFIASSTEAKNATDMERQSFFTPNDDYINLSEAYREDPKIHEITLKTSDDYDRILNLLALEEKSIPLFIENGKGIYLITEFEKEAFEKKDLVLSYLGKVIPEDQEK